MHSKGKGTALLIEVFQDTATECHLPWDHKVLPAILHK